MCVALLILFPVGMPFLLQTYISFASLSLVLCPFCSHRFVGFFSFGGGRECLLTIYFSSTGVSVLIPQALMFLRGAGCGDGLGRH